MVLFVVKLDKTPSYYGGTRTKPQWVPFAEARRFNRKLADGVARILARRKIQVSVIRLSKEPLVHG